LQNTKPLTATSSHLPIFVAKIIIMKHFFSALAVFCIASTAWAQSKPPKPAVKPSVKPTTKPATLILKNSTDSFSYAIGQNVASNLKKQGINKINTALLQKAMNDVMNNGTALMDDNTAIAVVNDYFNKLESEKTAPIKAAGKKFLEENKKRPGVVTTASGLQYEVIKAGNGPKPTASDKVRVHYHGTLIDGTVFDSSVEKGQPIEYPVTGFVQGWIEALQLMPVGSKWRLFVPSELGYGDRAMGDKIKGGSTLIFEMELLDILKQ
jgi:FKBP-type peptidyl-prolyl cis-trans isomerase FklB